MIMNTTELIKKVESVYLKKGLPAFRAEALSRSTLKSWKESRNVSGH